MKRRFHLYGLLIILLDVLLQACITWAESGGMVTDPKKEYSYKIITDRDLDWSDFTGRPDYSRSWAAAIYWRLFYTSDSVYTYGLPGDDGEPYVEPNIKVWCAIDERSWVKPRSKQENVLRHEQGHFNIARLCALDFQKTVEIMRPISRFNWKHRIDSVYMATLGKCRQMQNMYDVETLHGLDEKRQRLWDTKVNKFINKIRTLDTR